MQLICVNLEGIAASVFLYAFVELRDVWCYEGSIVRLFTYISFFILVNRQLAISSHTPVLGSTYKLSGN
jgi:hypothetical protein